MQAPYQKRRDFSESGITLAELLITTSIVAIIMIGVISADYAVRRTARTSLLDAELQLKTQATLAHISRNAMLAVGTIDDPGIVINGMNNDNTNYFCFRHDVNETYYDFTDDDWYCYTRRGYNLHTCVQVGPNPPAACGAGDTKVGTVIDTVFSDGVNPLFVTDNTSGAAKIYFEISLTNRVTPASVANYLTNPELTLETRVVPMGMSWN